VRLVDAAQLHLTLHYLGAVPESELPRWIRRLKVACTLFNLEGDRYALWPHGIAVWMPAAVPEGLLTLHQRLADRIVAAGHQLDPRPFQPHVTLARRTQAAALPPPRGARGVHWAVRGYALVESCTLNRAHRRRECFIASCTASAARPLEPRSPGVFDAHFAHHVAGR
jgi:2'-5' RNA ligase